MNLNAHRILSEGQSEAFNFGSILPDLTKMGGGRVKRVNSAGEMARLPDALQQIHAGVRFHIFIDQAYDNLPQVIALRGIFLNKIYPQFFSENRLLRRFLPVVAGDLLLDGVLLRKRPDAAGLVVKTVECSSSISSEDVSTNPIGLDIVLTRFIPNMPDYRMVDDVSRATQGVLGRRFGFELIKTGQENLFGAIKQLQPYVEHTGPSILESMTMIAQKYHANEVE